MKQLIIALVMALSLVNISYANELSNDDIKNIYNNLGVDITDINGYNVIDSQGINHNLILTTSGIQKSVQYGFLDGYERDLTGKQPELDPRRYWFN